MNYRVFGRTGWNISPLGYGMFGLAEWTGGNDKEIEQALNLSVEGGCNFFDTAWAYGKGKSEQILGNLIKQFPNQKLYIATKIPPKNFTWPAQKGSSIDEYLPAQHILDYTEKSLKNLQLERIDLLQFHLWEDNWSTDESWQRAVEDLKKQGKIEAIGISVNRWEPENVIETLKTGKIDAIQVIYNLFEQAPEDLLFPLCQDLNIGVIARSPFDEGVLTGTFTYDTRFPPDDWRSKVFTGTNLRESVTRVEQFKELLPADMTMPEMALRFILSHPQVHTTIAGMRRQKNVKMNIDASSKSKLQEDLIAEIKKLRWDRKRWWGYTA